MLWVPPERAVVENVVVPPEIVPVPNVVEPSLKVILPVAPAVTAAVKVTAFPYVEGLIELINVVLLFARFTVCERIVEVLAV